MNKDNAHLYLPHVQALADGELQYLGQGDWYDWGTPECSFSFPPEHYRRKPKPRVYWLVFDGGGHVIAAFSTETEALTWVDRPYSERTIAKFVEDVDSVENGCQHVC